MTPFIWFEYLAATVTATLIACVAGIVTWVLWQAAIGWIRGAVPEEATPAKPITLETYSDRRAQGGEM